MESLEISCWAAACQALAAVAPRYGITPEEVREICERSSEPRSGDSANIDDPEVLTVRRITVGLIDGIHQGGADRDSLVGIAQDAFETRRRLTMLDLPSEILGWDELIDDD